MGISVIMIRGPWTVQIGRQLMGISVIMIRGPWTVQIGRQLMGISVFNDTWPLDCTYWTPTDGYICL